MFDSSAGGIDPGAEEVALIASAIAGKNATTFISSMAGLLTIILGWWSILVEVFLRYDFGERYFSWVRFIMAASILSVISYLAYYTAIIGRDPDAGFSVPLTLFTVAFLIAGGIQRWRIRLRYLAGEPWHSKSTGVPRLYEWTGIDDWSLYLWWEPILCFVAAFLVGFFVEPLTGWVIGIGAFSLLTKNQIFYYAQRARILDLIDARLESQFYNEEASKKPKQQTAGISNVPVIWPKFVPAPAGIEDLQKTVNATLGKTPPPPPAAGSPSPVPDDLAKTIADTMKPDDKD